MVELINSNVVDLVFDKAKIYETYVGYVGRLSDRRQLQFGHFITIHLFLLPAHMAVVSRNDQFGIVYSILVSILGMIICFVSYRRISATFTRIDKAYKLIHELEATLPYQFFRKLAELMGDGDKTKGKWYQIRLRRTELAFHWIIGLIYLSLPVVHYNMSRIAAVFPVKGG